MLHVISSYPTAPPHQTNFSFNPTRRIICVCSRLIVYDFLVRNGLNRVFCGANEQCENLPPCSPIAHPPSDSASTIEHRVCVCVCVCGARLLERERRARNGPHARAQRGVLAAFLALRSGASLLRVSLSGANGLSKFSFFTSVLSRAPCIRSSISLSARRRRRAGSSSR